jgi:hypothetical protein
MQQVLKITNKNIPKHMFKRNKASDGERTNM